MITYLKDREVYEDRYDRITVEIGRREGASLGWALSESLEKMENKGLANFWEERMYWWLFEIPYLLPRWEERDVTIESWMFEDRMLDKRLEESRPLVEPKCESCKKQGLRLVNKLFLSRESGDERRSVLFMFDCGSCKKRTACWEDGVVWHAPVIPCPKCRSSLNEDVTVKGYTMTTMTKCQSCDYSNVEKTKIGMPKEPDDSLYEEHKKLFCLDDERGALMQTYREKLKEMMPILEEDMKRDADKELHSKVAKVPRLKIPEAIDLLRPAIEAAGYREVMFEKPDLGVYVSISFCCMDGNMAREDAQSRKVLKQAIVKALGDTNWRLMSEGISYRLGYLTGRVRVYEEDDEIVQLISGK